ncbi:MAG: GAF domain-containing protein [Eubacteriales bacterium]|nr:GAF domain-containing protein [Eubacteriales bacterium]
MDNESKPQTATTVSRNCTLTSFKSLLDATPAWISKASQAIAFLNSEFKIFNWIGYYFVQDTQLHLGPFIGQVACNPLHIGRPGVCAHAYREASAIYIPDVEKFPGHIACDSRSRSEWVFPLKNQEGKIYALLDIDSPVVAAADEIDQICLTDLVRHLEEQLSKINEAQLSSVVALNR